MSNKLTEFLIITNLTEFLIKSKVPKSPQQCVPQAAACVRGASTHCLRNTSPNLSPIESIIMIEILSLFIFGCKV